MTKYAHGAPKTAENALETLLQAFNDAYRERINDDPFFCTTVVEQRVRQNPLVRP